MKKWQIGLVGLLLLLVGGFFAWPGTIERLDAIASNPNPLIRHFSPTWRSIKRITDIPYTLVYSFRKTTLPVYELTISKDDKKKLLDNLPDYPAKSAMWENYKTTVKSDFRAGSYYTKDAKIRHRGVSPNHWNAAKKSWQINLPAETPLGDQTDIRLFIPEDKGWVIGALNAHRAEKLGLITPSISYVRLSVNTVDMGVYLSIEGWEETLLEKHGHPLGPIFSNQNLDIRNVDLFKPESITLWENRFDAETPIQEYGQLMYFLKLIANAPDDVFERELPTIVNMDKLYRWMTVSILSGSMHQGNIANQNWYFNQATGKLEPVSFDTALTRINTALDISGNRLANRAMKTTRFNKEFNNFLSDYVNNPENLADDIAFYDKTAAEIRPDILSDSKKIQTSKEVLRLIQEQREIVIHNFETAKKMFATQGSFVFKYSAETYPLTQAIFGITEFERTFLAAGASAQDFVRKNPQFRLRGADTLVLPAGTHMFSHTVIVPRNLKLIIEPGARLVFNPNISFISYSPVESRGTASAPVRMQARFSDLPWGVFAVIDAPGTNIFRYTHIQDGKDTTMNGLYFSGNLSVRASNLDFEYSSIARSHADDGIHVLDGRARIASSRFTDASADAIDIDFARDSDSLFEKNTFVNGGGDAMDLSFSKIIVRGNTVTNCGDKGISVGEASHPIIEHNIIVQCVIGIAVKDRSEAHISQTFLLENKTGMDLYLKKPHFMKGGAAHLTDSILWGNNIDIHLDPLSQVTVEKSVVEHGYPGDRNSNQQPDFTALLPAQLLLLLKTI